RNKPGMILLRREVGEFQLQREAWSLQIPAQVGQVGNFAREYGRLNLSVQAIALRISGEAPLGSGFPHLLELDLSDTFAHPFGGLSFPCPQEDLRLGPGEHRFRFLAVSLLELAATLKTQHDRLFDFRVWARAIGNVGRCCRLATSSRNTHTGRADSS